MDEDSDGTMPSHKACFSKHGGNKSLRTQNVVGAAYMGRLLHSSFEEKFSKPRKTEFHLVFSEEIKTVPLS